MAQKSRNTTFEENIKKIHKSVLAQVRPKKNTRRVIVETIIELFDQTIRVIKSQNFTFNLEPILVGSTAKDTYLNDPDIDLFIMFPTNVPVEELRNLGLELGKKILPHGEERYAEHPYIKGKFNGFDTDIVPCYKLKDINNRMTAVDRTPFHTRFITEHLKSNQRDEVRLLKQFMKGINVYGAEIAVQGFSGYLCELLILKYATFLGLLKNASEWPDRVVLTQNVSNINNTKNLPDNYEYQNKTKLLKNLTSKFKNEPLIFIDPVDSSRNVASAVSVENLIIFIKAAKKYLKNPRLEFFLPNAIKPFTLNQLQERVRSLRGSLIGIEFQTPEVIPDVLYGQVRKCQRAIERLLLNSEFSIEYSKYFVDDKILLLFELTPSQLPETEIHTGPPDGHKNVEDFLTKWKTSSQALCKPYLENGRWYVKLRRDFTEPKKLLEKKILDLNLGKQINLEIDKEFKIYVDNDLLNTIYIRELTEFFERKFPWEY